jgi:cell division protease FtsH
LILNQLSKNLALVLLMLLFAVLLFHLLSDTNATKPEELPYSTFLDKVAAGQIKTVVIEGFDISGDEITGKYLDETEFTTFAPNDPDILRTLREYNVDFEAKPMPGEPVWRTLLYWAPFILLFGFWFVIMRQMQSGGGKALSFGKSKAKLLSEDSKKYTFEDVAGIEEAKAELEEIIEFLRDPKKFTRLGGRIPKGVLLIGPPGTGKTLLGRAIAGEAGVPFFSISGSDFVEMFVGVGASRVRDLFIQGKKNAPCIIFIDEIDAVGRQRGAGLGGGHDEREQTLNQLLVEMDGFESNEGVILISATNRPDVLDPALLRPGRFDRQVIVPHPDVRGREGILAVHSRKVPLANDVSLEVIARGTPGFSGADLENLVNEAALLAARKNQTQVDMHAFEMAKDKVLMGVERKSMIISEKEKRVTAYHEAGHALVAKILPDSDPVHKITIIPRGMALGLTQTLPEEDKHNYSKGYLKSQLAKLLGGRCAEELVLGELTTGAGNDIERATEIARRMVCEWGMSDKLGPLTFGKPDREIFLGRDIASNKDYSEQTAMEIDAEIRSLIDEAHKKAYATLEENIDMLHATANALLDRETLTGAELNMLIEGQELPPLAKVEEHVYVSAKDYEAEQDDASESFGEDEQETEQVADADSDPQKESDSVSIDEDEEDKQA